MLDKVSTDQGFFKKHHAALASSLSDEDIKIFSSLTSNESRISFVYNLPTAQKIPFQVAQNDRDYDTAKSLKDQGNKAFKNENYKQAHDLYTSSILKSPWKTDSNPELAVGFANRSAALYHMQEYDLALADIELCQSLGYPPDLQYKIADRKARCLLAKKQLKDALKAFQSTLIALDSAKLAIERKRKCQMDVQIMLSMLAKNANLANADSQKSKIILPEVSHGSSPLYKAASIAINVEQTPELGRYAVAHKNINVGDTLVVESAYCSVLLPENVKTHCFHCFQRLKNPVPCPHCTNVQFCGKICQEKALQTHHKIECNVLNTLWSAGASITCLMALRILSQTRLQNFLSLQSKLGQAPNVYRSSDYLNVFNLVTHEAKRTSDDLLHRTNMAVFLLKCLQTGSFFGTPLLAEKPPTQHELFIGGLLLHHLQLLQFNAHEISELVIEKDGNIESGTSVFLGGGLYPTLALFNHSCDPGVIRYFKGTSVVVRAAKNILAGEIISENYGPIFTQTPREQRQLSLQRQYWFKCTCIPCEENWPCFNYMTSDILRFKCDGDSSFRCTNIIEVPTNTMEFMIQCVTCKKYTNILKGLKALEDTDSIFKTAKHLMKQKDISKALEIFCDLLNRLDKTLAPPFQDYHLCQQAIRRCMLYFGNCFQK